MNRSSRHGVLKNLPLDYVKFPGRRTQNSAVQRTTFEWIRNFLKSWAMEKCALSQSCRRWNTNIWSFPFLFDTVKRSRMLSNEYECTLPRKALVGFQEINTTWVIAWRLPWTSDHDIFWVFSVLVQCRRWTLAEAQSKCYGESQKAIYKKEKRALDWNGFHWNVPMVRFEFFPAPSKMS